MASKGDIGWKRRDADGERVQVSAKKVGNRWLFRIRGKRNERWLEHSEPPLEDWLELLDAVRRRIERDLIPEIEEDRLKKSIREKFPEATL